MDMAWVGVISSAITGFVSIITREPRKTSVFRGNFENAMF